MKGTFFAVGVGPGDPELLTLKAVKTIKQSDVIALPDSGADKNTALEIAKEYIKDKQVIYLKMPMTKDEKILEESHNAAAAEVAQLLDNGKAVSFLTLGDPTVYSTVMYVHKRLKNMGYPTAVISGITSFCAAAASLNTSLCEKSESLHIIPATYSDIDKAIALDGCKVLMKSGKAMEKFKDKLKKSNAKIVECATMENEKIYDCSKDLETLPGYFSVVIIKD